MPTDRATPQQAREPAVLYRLSAPPAWLPSVRFPSLNPLDNPEAPHASMHPSVCLIPTPSLACAVRCLSSR